jgi:hypothetical protein
VSVFLSVLTFVLGLAAITTGAALIAPAAGFIVGGLCSVLVGVLLVADANSSPGGE